MGTTSGFEELDHMADWAIKISAPSLLGLLETAVQGMYALSEIQFEDGPGRQEPVAIDAPDAEMLLVDFLTELLFYGEQGEAVRGMALRLEGFSLSGSLRLAPIRSQAKEIKAVTYHNLHVKKTSAGFEVVLVFDV